MTTFVTNSFQVNVWQKLSKLVTVCIAMFLWTMVNIQICYMSTHASLLYTKGVSERNL